MSNADIVFLCVFGGIEVVLVILLVITHLREKKMKHKPHYYSAVGNWLSGKRR